MTDDQPRTDRMRQSWFIGLLVIYAACLMLEGFSFKYGLLKRAMVGAHFYEHALPQLKELQPPISPLHGYDGQFYLQMAFDPTLQDPNLAAAVDSIGYRGQRIGLSALSNAIGFGNPAIVAQVYCGLNFVFWLALLWLMIQNVGIETLEQRCFVLVTLFTAGAVVSMWRALTDLPAVTLGLLAATLASSPQNNFAKTIGGWFAFVGSNLCKETSVLSLISLIKLQNKRSFLTSSFAMILAVTPLIAWLLYARHQVGSARSGLQNFTYPFFGFFQKVYAALSNAWNEFPSIHIDEIISPISIMIQVAYFAVRCDWKNPIWRFGVGFAVLTLFLSQPVWEAQSAFSRVLLPMTIAFNLQLASELAKPSARSSDRKERQNPLKKTLTWFWLGNLGLIDRALPILVVWYVAERIIASSRIKKASLIG